MTKRCPFLLSGWFLLLTLACALHANATQYKASLLSAEELGFDAFEFWDVTQDGISKVGTGAGPSTNGNQHAVLLNGTSESVIDLNPAGFNSSSAEDASGEYQVGWGRVSMNGFLSPTQALLWNGTAESVVNLHPAGYEASYATGVSGEYQVGGGGSTNGFLEHALLWNGTAESAVNLTPPGFVGSRANGISGGTQVGHVVRENELPRAALWTGTAESYVSLHPAGYDYSFANAASGDTQVGNGIRSSFDSHALLWHGTAGSVVDLHVTGNDSSVASDVAGNVQVGFVIPDNFDYVTYAYAWSGTAESAVNLHPYLDDLEPDFLVSTATAIADDGTIFGSAFDGAISYTVIWTPIVPLAGDFDGDGDVDGADFVLWQRGESPEPLSADDLAAWEANYGASLAQDSTSAVPEPTASGLLFCALFGTASLLRRSN